MQAHSSFKASARRWRWSLLGMALSFLHLSAHADLWAYVDEQGITHFAATQADERYQLFFKGSDAARLDLNDAASLSPAKARRLGLKSNGTEQPAFVPPKRFANIDASRGYQSVQKHLQAAAKTHKVDYELLKAVVAAESGFDADAVSPKGAVGLMQLMPTTAVLYGVVADKADRRDRKGHVLPARSVEEKLTDPKTNIDAGARYLAYLIKLFKGELELAVAAYNAGEGAVQRAGNKIPNYRETQGYVKTVMGLYGVFKPEPAGRAARADGSAVASIASRMGGRVRVELGGAPSQAGAAAADAALRLMPTTGSLGRPLPFGSPATGAL